MYSPTSSLRAFFSTQKKRFSERLKEFSPRTPSLLLLLVLLAVGPLAVGTAFLGATPGSSGAPQGDGQPTRASDVVRYASLGATPATRKATASEANASEASAAGYAAASVALPIEVIGPTSGYTEEVTLPLPDAVGVDRLWMQVHRPAYRDQKTNAGRGAKASVRLNGGEWVDLTNRTARVAEREAQNGGIGGGPHTVRLSVPIDGARSGNNTVTFRFNGTDGVTSGYRVLQLNFLRGGAKVLPESAFTHADPSTWEAPSGYRNTEDIEAGRRLWHEADLVESAALGQSDHDIEATCSGCHAEDGSDLKYFGYSNKSIRWRAEFHGMSTEEGRQIAAYIRSLDVEVPENGRPWNPPYQPGPGLDDKDASAWAAGAGLDAVLDEDAEMAEYLFPNGISKEAIAGEETMNVREQPIAMELPDWNAWLPNRHPVDVWGRFFRNKADVDRSTPAWRGDILGQLQELRKKLETKGPEAMAADGSLMPQVRNFGTSGRRYFLDNAFGGGNNARPGEVEKEDATRSIRHWSVVKLFELHQKYGLNDKAPQVFGEQGEARSWITGKARTVFDLAPHRSANNGANFREQTLRTGKYRSTSWYQLQMVLNTGNGRGYRILPLDWNYHPGHIAGLYRAGGGSHPLRQAQAFMKMLQLYTDGRDIDKFYIRQIHPARYGPRGKESDMFDEMQNTRLRRQIYEALLGALMDELEAYSISDWDQKRSRGVQKQHFASKDYIPQPLQRSLGRAIHRGKWVDGWYTVIPRFGREANVCNQVLDRMIDWGSKMWPRGDWEAIRGTGSSDCIATEGAGLAEGGETETGDYKGVFGLTDYVTAKTRHPDVNFHNRGINIESNGGGGQTYVRFQRDASTEFVSGNATLWIQRKGSSRRGQMPMIAVYEIDGDGWNEENLTYAQAPSPGRRLDIRPADGSERKGWIGFDVSGAVKSGAEDGSVAFMLRQSPNGKSERIRLATRSEQAAQPKLVPGRPSTSSPFVEKSTSNGNANGGREDLAGAGKGVFNLTDYVTAKTRHPDVNFHNRGINVERDGGGGETYVRFGRNARAPFATKEATLWVRRKGKSRRGQEPEVSVYQVEEEGWNEEDLTYAQVPAVGKRLDTRAAGGHTMDGWIGFDVSDAVKSGARGGSVAFVLKQAAGGPSERIPLAGRSDQASQPRLVAGTPSTSSPRGAEQARGSYAAAGGPRPATLTRFSAEWTDGAARLQWATAADSGGGGFQVWRKVRDAPPEGRSSEDEGSYGGATYESGGAYEEGSYGNSLPRRDLSEAPGDANEDLAEEGFEQVTFVEGSSRENAAATTAAGPAPHTFADEDLPYEANWVTYRLVKVDAEGNETPFTRAVTVEVAAPERFALEPNFPNPFRERTTLRYQLQTEAEVTLAVYDARGRKVKTIVAAERQPGGRHSVRFEAGSLASGVYFARLMAKAEGGTVTKTQKLVLVR